MLADGQATAYSYTVTTGDLTIGTHQYPIRGDEWKLESNLCMGRQAMCPDTEDVP